MQMVLTKDELDKAATEYVKRMLTEYNVTYVFSGVVYTDCSGELNINGASVSFHSEPKVCRS